METPTPSDSSSNRGPLLGLPSKGQRRRSPGLLPPPDPPPRPSGLKIVAGLGVYTGLIGSLAFLIAYATDLDLWSMFDWSSKDVPISLAYLLPLQIINSLIMLPDFSSLDFSSVPKDVSVMKKYERKPEPEQRPAAEAPEPILDLSTLDTRPLSSFSQAASNPPASAVATPESVVSAASWGKEDVKRRLQKQMSRFPLRDAFFIAQSHFAANNPTAGLNLGVEILSTSISSLSTELLYRGVSISLLASWINDRLYEGGCDDFISLPSCILFLLGHSEGSLMSLEPLPMGTYEAARWAASMALVGLSVSLVIRKLVASSKIPVPIIIQEVDNDKPDALVSDKKKKKLDSLKLRKGLEFKDTIKIANAIQGCRNVSQTLCLNFIFAATGGNLAASYAASIVNQAIFSVLQHCVTLKIKARSVQLAAELKDFNEKLRDIQTRQEMRLQLEEKKKSLVVEKAPESSLVESTEFTSGSTMAQGGEYAAAGFIRDSFSASDIHEGVTQLEAQPSAIGLSPANEVNKDHEPAGSEFESIKKTLSALDLLLPPETNSKS